jgi:hypothetical protein
MEKNPEYRLLLNLSLKKFRILMKKTKFFCIHSRRLFPNPPRHAVLLVRVRGSSASSCCRPARVQHQGRRLPQIHDGGGDEPGRLYPRIKSTPCKTAPPRRQVCGGIIALLLFLIFIRKGFTESMEVEVLRFEKIANSASSTNERRLAYAQMAGLLYLAGDMARAAAAWQSAALVDKNNRDDIALVEAAACFIAIGEFDKASANVRAALVSGKTPAVIPKARYFASAIEAFRSLDTKPLISLLHDPICEPYKPAIYYIIWKIDDSDVYKTKLFSEYPNSPEALAINGEKTVSSFPSIFWQFLPGIEKIPEAGMLQTGSFNKEENAGEWVKKLKLAEFEAEISKKTVKGQILWIVLVPGGENINMTLSRLKAAGFDAFPVK